MVHYVGEKIHVIKEEMEAWRDILSIPYQEYKQLISRNVRGETFTS